MNSPAQAWYEDLSNSCTEVLILLFVLIEDPDNNFLCAGSVLESPNPLSRSQIQPPASTPEMHQTCADHPPVPLWRTCDRTPVDLQK